MTAADLDRAPSTSPAAGDDLQLPDGPGVYQLHLSLAADTTIAVGRLGVFTFPAGRYLYTGSALGGLRHRVARHLRSDKAVHWHIDYLLRHAAIVWVTAVPTRRRLECVLNREALELPGARAPVRGFGSSDCRCPSHLVYLGANGPRSSAEERAGARAK